MNVSLDKNVQILSEHYVNRFKHLIDTNRQKTSRCLLNRSGICV